MPAGLKPDITHAIVLVCPAEFPQKVSNSLFFAEKYVKNFSHCFYLPMAKDPSVSQNFIVGSWTPLTHWISGRIGTRFQCRSGISEGRAFL